MKNLSINEHINITNFVIPRENNLKCIKKKLHLKCNGKIGCEWGLSLKNAVFRQDVFS